jgi:RHS repeat-associated protein
VGSVAKTIDPRGNITLYEYDELGRTSTVTDALDNTAGYEYNTAGNTIAAYLNGAKQISYTYDKLGRTLTTTDSRGYTASYTYNNVGAVLTYTDRNGNETAYEYDGNYNTVKVTNALGGTTVYVYDELNRQTSVTDAAGNITSYTYDAVGNLLTTTDALSGTTTNTYSPGGKLTAAKDALDVVTNYAYDAAGNLTSITDAAGKTTVNFYDANGNLTRTTNRENESESYEYDEMNRLVKATNALNHSTSYVYDLAGNTVSSSDGNKNDTTYVYDALNRLITETTPEGSVKEYVYDARGNLLSMTLDAGGGARSVTTYSYDTESNLTGETSPLGYSSLYTYDAEGNLLTAKDENENITTYSYDALNRATEYTDADGTVSYTYDAVGNLTGATSATGTVSFTYDALYRTTLVTNEDGTTTGYTYDANGNRTSLTYPDGQAVNYTYDNLGNLTALTDYDATEIVYTRDAEGRVTKETHPDGSTTEYDYNAAGQLTQQKEIKNNSTLRETLYGYDDAGNLTNEQRRGIDVDKRDESVRYYYDKDNQLTRTVIEGVTTNYTYDLAGNLTSDGEYTYTYDAQNRLTEKTGSDGKTTYEYDAAGNLTREVSPDGSVTYTYNAQNRLTKGSNSDGSYSEYTYNAMGARIQNVQYRENANAGYENVELNNGSENIKDYTPALDDERATWESTWETEVGTVVQREWETVTVNYTVDYLSVANRDIMVETVGAFVTRYVYDPDGTRISAEFSYADGTERGDANEAGEYGENIASDVAVLDLGKVWFRGNLVGSSLYAVDSDGETVVHAIYDPWGNPVTETAVDLNFTAIVNLNNYTGYTWDETLGLFFAQYRFYDAENHRFTQQDTARDGGNWYVYCANNPMGYVDPFGFVYTELRKLAESYGFDVSWNNATRNRGAGATVSKSGYSSKYYTATNSDKDGAYLKGGKMMIDQGMFYRQWRISYSSSRTDQARFIQYELNWLGYTGKNGYGLSVDGIIGQNTLYAVVDYKASNSIKPVTQNINQVFWNSILGNNRKGPAIDLTAIGNAFGRNSDTYKIVADVKSRWHSAAVSGNYSNMDYFHELACDAVRLAREGTPYMYGQDKVMNTLHANAETGIAYMEALSSNFWFLASGGDPFAASYGWFVGMALSDWDYKYDSSWQVKGKMVNGKEMFNSWNLDEGNNRNWRPWIYFDGRIISADDVGNINLGYVGTKMGFSSFLLEDAVDLWFLNIDDVKDQESIKYGSNMARSGR